MGEWGDSCRGFKGLGFGVVFEEEEAHLSSMHTLHIVSVDTRKLVTRRHQGVDVRSMTLQNPVLVLQTSNVGDDVGGATGKLDGGVRDIA